MPTPAIAGGDNWTFDTAGGPNDGFRKTAVDPKLTPASSVRHERLGRHKEEKVFTELPLAWRRWSVGGRMPWPMDLAPAARGHEGGPVEMIVTGVRRGEDHEEAAPAPSS